MRGTPAADKTVRPGATANASARLARQPRVGSAWWQRNRGHRASRPVRCVGLRQREGSLPGKCRRRFASVRSPSLSTRCARRPEYRRQTRSDTPLVPDRQRSAKPSTRSSVRGSGSTEYTLRAHPRVADLTVCTQARAGRSGALRLRRQGRPLGPKGPRKASAVASGRRDPPFSCRLEGWASTA